MKKLFLTIAFVFALAVNGWCANRYWVGGGSAATWAATGNTNWGTATATRDNAAVPTDADDVIFDGGDTSACTVGADASFKSITFGSGYSGAFVLSGGKTMYAHGSITVDAATNFTVQSSASFEIHDNCSITSAGKDLRSITVNGAGKTVILADNLTLASTVKLVTGTLKTDGASDTSGLTHSWSSFSSTNGNTRALTLGNSTITCSLAGNAPWNMDNFAGCTLSAGTSTLIFSGASPYFWCANGTGSSQTYYTVSFTGSGYPIIYCKAGTVFTNFYRTGTAVKTDGITFAKAITVNGELKMVGNTASNRLLCTSYGFGTAQAITLGASAIFKTNTVNADFRDITVSGGAAGERDLSAITGGSGDCGGNTGITFNTPATWYWNGSGTRNFSDYTYWFDTTNGGGSQMASTRTPLPQDTCKFNGDSIDGATTVDQDMVRIPGIDFTGVGAMNFHMNNLGSTQQEIYGSLIFVSNVTLTAPSSGGITFSGRGNFFIDMAGRTFGDAPNYISAPSGTYNLSSDYTQTANYFYLSYGTFDAGIYNVNLAAFSFSGTTTRRLDMGSGTWTISLSIWTATTTTNLTFNKETANIVLSYASTSNRTFDGGGLTYNNLSITGGSTGIISIVGSNTFGTLTINKPKTVTFANDSITTVSSLVATGDVSNHIIIQSATATSNHFHISQASGTSVNDYLDVIDSVADQANTFYYGANGSGTRTTNWEASAGGAYTGFINVNFN